MGSRRDGDAARTMIGWGISAQIQHVRRFAMNESTSVSLLGASTWLRRQRRRVKVRRSLSPASQFAGEVLEYRTLLSSIDHLIGTSPRVKGSELVLDLPADPANNRTFLALSNDSALGMLDIAAR
jgi:hypothetical protein